MNLRFRVLPLTASLGFVRAGSSAIAERLLQFRWPFVVFAAALSLSVVGVGASQSPPSTAPPMPDYLEVPGIYERPIFVAAELTVLPDGQINRAFFPDEYLADGFELFLSREQTDGCILARDTTDALSRSPGSHQDLASAIGATDNVIEAEVSGSRLGFTFERPGTLIRLDVMAVLKGSAPAETKYIHFPVGDLDVGGTRICARSSIWGELPRVGDRVIVLFNGHQHNQAVPVLAIAPSGVLTVRDGRIASLPALYRKTNVELRGQDGSQVSAAVRLQALEAGEE